jgi:hypothetical protein
LNDAINSIIEYSKRQSLETELNLKESFKVAQKVGLSIFGDVTN